MMKRNFAMSDFAWWESLGCAPGARDPPSAARAEQLRAMKAANQMGDSSRRKDGLKLPPPSGGNKTRTGGFNHQQQQQGIMVSVESARRFSISS